MAKPSDLEFLKQALSTPTQHIAIGIVKTLEFLADKSSVRSRVEIFPDKRMIIARLTWDAASSGGGVFMMPSIGDLVMLEFLTDENGEGDVDQAYITRRLSSKEDFVPEYAQDGSLVLKAKPGKKAWLTSDTQINLSKGETAPTENLVLGQIFKQYESDLLDTIKSLDGTLSDLAQILADQASTLAGIATTLSTMSTSLAAHTHTETGTTTSAPSDAALHTANAATFATNSTTLTTTQTDILTKKAEIVANDGDLSTLKASPITDESILSDLAFTEKGD